MSKVVALIFISLLLGSCDELSNIKTTDELKEYVSDEKNGLSLSHEQGELSFNLSYYPKQLIIGDEIQSVRDSAKLSELRERYNDFEYFKLSISYNDKSYLHQLPKAQYSEYVNVFSFRMQNYVHLKLGDNKYQPIDYQFEQLYGLNSADNFLFVFAKKDLKLEDNKKIKFIIEDFGLSTGKQVFELNSANIEAINKLELQHHNTAI